MWRKLGQLSANIFLWQKRKFFSAEKQNDQLLHNSQNTIILVSDLQKEKGHKILFSTMTAPPENATIEKAVVSKQVARRHELLNIHFI